MAENNEGMSIEEAIGILVDMRFDDFDGVYTFSDEENTAMWMGQRALQICKEKGYSIWRADDEIQSR